MSEEKFKVRMGEILVAQADITYENDKNQKTTIRKGEKSVLGFDGAIHRLRQRTIIIPDESFEIVGYCAAGLADFITVWLDKNLDLENVLKKSEYSVDDVRECVETALIEIGMEAENDEDEKSSKEIAFSD